MSGGASAAAPTALGRQARSGFGAPTAMLPLPPWPPPHVAAETGPRETQAPHRTRGRRRLPASRGQPTQGLRPPGRAAWAAVRPGVFQTCVLHPPRDGHARGPLSSGPAGKFPCVEGAGSDRPDHHGGPRPLVAAPTARPRAPAWLWLQLNAAGSPRSSGSRSQPPSSAPACAPGRCRQRCPRGASTLDAGATGGRDPPGRGQPPASAAGHRAPGSPRAAPAAPAPTPHLPPGPRGGGGPAAPARPFPRGPAGGVHWSAPRAALPPAPAAQWARGCQLVSRAGSVAREPERRRSSEHQERSRSGR